jgi:hypothetical protein
MGTKTVKSTILLLLLVNVSIAQDNIDTSTTKMNTILFQNPQPISIKLQFSIKDLKKNTTDSTYIKSSLYFKNAASQYDSIDIKLRARGNYRRTYCYYVPLKLKIKKSLASGTPFEGNKELKVVLPCSTEPSGNDYLIKEYLAYKLYEIVSPIHFSTRLADIEFVEEKGRREKIRHVKGILIEDLKKVAKRFDGKEMTREVHPLNHDAYTSVTNSFFQCMIGNTDFSTRLHHNDKLLFIDKKIVGIPYDFDMSGLVDADYAAVSGTENLGKEITEVTQRLYKGYKRDESIFYQVRQDFLGHKMEMLKVADNLQEYFVYPNQFEKAKEFILSFFEILEDDKEFDKNILKQARTR